MARNTTTTGAVFIPEVWANEVKAAREEALVLRGRIKMFGHTGKAGDTIHVPDVSNLDANDMSETGEVQAQAITESETTISLDKWKEASFRVNDLLKVQSQYDLRTQYTGKAGFAIGKREEQDLMALGTSASGSFDADGTAASAAGGNMNQDGVLRAVRYLDEQNVPATDRTLVVSPLSRNKLLAIEAFVSADFVNKKATVDAKIGEIYGLDVLVSNLLPSDGNSKVNNLMFHKEALALAVQKEISVEAQRELAKLSWLVVTDEVYGVKLFRSDHIVRMIEA
jgi:N4-gp56 family major capsid protein